MNFLLADENTQYSSVHEQLFRDTKVRTSWNSSPQIVTFLVVTSGLILGIAWQASFEQIRLLSKFIPKERCKKTGNVENRNLLVVEHLGI